MCVILCSRDHFRYDDMRYDIHKYLSDIPNSTGVLQLMAPLLQLFGKYLLDEDESSNYVLCIANLFMDNDFYSLQIVGVINSFITITV